MLQGKIPSFEIRMSLEIFWELNWIICRVLLKNRSASGIFSCDDFLHDTIYLYDFKCDLKQDDSYDRLQMAFMDEDPSEGTIYRWVGITNSLLDRNSQLEFCASAKILIASLFTLAGSIPLQNQSSTRADSEWYTYYEMPARSFPCNEQQANENRSPRASPRQCGRAFSAQNEGLPGNHTSQSLGSSVQF